MKKQIRYAIVAMLCCLALLLTLAACDIDGNKREPDDTGANNQTPYIGENGNWWIGDTDTKVKAEGKDGADGKDGNDGQTPYIGENGNWWIGDTDTKVKAEGKDGADGNDGQTPYIGENGNWWIGDTDTKGKAEGKNGADGNDGNDGQTPYIGENGNWWIGDTDTKVKAEGKDGADGNDGQTPYIGENGNWWIGDTDTEVKAEGKDGADGNDGKDGDTGISITGAYIDQNNHLILTMSNGTTLDAGRLCIHEIYPQTAVLPTCTEPGMTAGEACIHCGQVFSGCVEIPALGGEHQVVTVPAKDPTCDRDGHTEYSYCSVCNKKIVSDHWLPATGEHTYEGGVCTECGKAEV